MKYLMDLFSMHIGDLEFCGFKFSTKLEEFPKMKSKEIGAYLDSLVEEGSIVSRIRYKGLFSQIQKVEIHSKLSFSFAFGAIAAIIMGLAILASLYVDPILGLAFLGVSFGNFLLYKYYRRRAKELYIGLLTTPDLIDYMFATENESPETN